MALDQNAKYPSGTAAATSDYPEGSAVNSTAPGALNGYPLDKDQLNDRFGFEQALLRSMGQAASGSPDTARFSQYLQGVIELASGRAFTYDEVGIADIYVLNARANQQLPADYFNGLVIKFIPLNNNTGASTVNLGAIGVKNLKPKAGFDFSANDLVAGVEYIFTYDGVDFILTSQSKVLASGVGAVPRTIQEKDRDIVNAADFGDLTVDIGAAINLAMTNGHYVIEVPAGDWTQATQITDPTSQLTIYCNPGLNMFGFNFCTITKTDDFPHIEVSISSFISYGIRWDGTGVVGTSHGVILHKKCEFFGSIRNQPGDGLHITRTAAGHNVNGTVFGGEFALNGGDGVLIDDSTVAGSATINTNLIYSPRLFSLFNGGDGVKIKGALFPMLDNCQCDSNTGWGFRINATNAVKDGRFQVYAESNTAGNFLVDGAYTAGVFRNIFLNPRGFDASNIIPSQGNVVIRGNRHEITENGAINTGLIILNSSSNSIAEGGSLAFEHASSLQQKVTGRGDGSILVESSGSGAKVQIGDGIFDGQPMALGSDYMWIDGGNIVRFKPSVAPLAADAGFSIGSQTPAYNSSSFTDAAHVLNSATNKAEGITVFDAILNKPLWAVGAATTDVWVDATGATVHTPS